MVYVVKINGSTKKTTSKRQAMSLYVKEICKNKSAEELQELEKYLLKNAENILIKELLIGKSNRSAFNKVIKEIVNQSIIISNIKQ